MTGFAEKSFDSSTLSTKISIRALNHRYFDWFYRGTPIGSVENKLRAACQKRLHRGRVEVSLELISLDSSKWDFWINQELLRKMLSSLEKFFSEVKRDLTISVDDIFSIPHVVEMKRKEFTEEEVSFLERAFEKTLEELIKARKKEGGEIKRKVRSHIQNIRKIMRNVEKLARKHPLTIREKLDQRLAELAHESSLSEEKTAEEAAFIAQKYDLTEEVTRLKSHLKYMEELLSSRTEEPVGKKLDFVAQELYREANTVNSKSQDIQLIREILAVKSEVESIRQQAQNLE